MSFLQKRIFLLSFLFAIFIFIVHFLLIKTAIYGDGRYYYSYLPTFLIQHSFNFSISFHVYGLPILYTPNHYLQNPHTIGPALTWTLPYLFGFSIFSLFHNGNPYNVFLQIPVGLGNITLVFLGLFFLFQSLKKYFSGNTAFITTLAVFFTTNLFFYGAIDVLNSHSASFFFASTFVYFWLQKFSIKQSIILGATLGMLILCRTQDGIFILLPLLTLIRYRQKYLIYFFILTGVTILFLIPQSYIWHVLWGNWFRNPYLYGTTFNFLSPNVFGVLFNFYDGLFLWTPISVIALYGLFLFSSKNEFIRIGGITIFLITLYFIASFEIWWGGASFSARYFISTFPLLAFGLATFFEKYLSVKKQLLVTLLFSLLNFSLIGYFLLRS